MGLAVGQRRHLETGRGTPRVVEVAGPTGAGKSTLVRALGRTVATTRGSRHFRRVTYIPFFAGAAVASLRLGVNELGRGVLGWREVAMMAHLRALQLELALNPGDRRAVVFDQGPVFMLARLCGRGVEDIQNETTKRWWHRVISRWGSTIDVVVQLDAPDAVLLQRVRERQKWHAIKDQPEETACDFLHRFRASYERVMATLTAAGRLRLLRFDTSKGDLSRVVDEILGVLR